MNEYTEFRYLYPPRPENKVAPMTMNMMPKLGYVAQKKRNGTCTIIFARGSEVIFKTRHPEYENGNHRAWQPNDRHMEFFGSLSNKWNVFVGELLHSKGEGVRDEIFLFDQLVHEGTYLVGSTFIERQALMVARWPDGEDEGDQFRIHEHVALAKLITKDFKKEFENLNTLDEGLVFKLAQGKLRPCVSANANSAWQSKCRHPKAKTYSF